MFYRRGRAIDTVFSREFTFSRAPLSGCCGPGGCDTLCQCLQRFGTTAPGLRRVGGQGGLNLRAGQRLSSSGPLASGGASLEAAPLIRHIVTSAYKAGASLVEVIWGDDTLQLARLRMRRAIPSVNFRWLPKALFEHAEGGNAVLSVYANDPIN